PRRTRSAVPASSSRRRPRYRRLLRSAAPWRPSVSARPGSSGKSRARKHVARARRSLRRGGTGLALAFSSFPLSLSPQGCRFAVCVFRQLLTRCTALALQTIPPCFVLFFFFFF